jgi:hypothetical protein
MWVRHLTLETVGIPRFSGARRALLYGVREQLVGRLESTRDSHASSLRRSSLKKDIYSMFHRRAKICGGILLAEKTPWWRDGSKRAQAISGPADEIENPG